MGKRVAIASRYVQENLFVMKYQRELKNFSFRHDSG